MGDAKVVDGCAVVLIDDRLGQSVPSAAVPLLRDAAAAYAERGLAEATRQSLGLAIPPPTADLLAEAARHSVVLVAPAPGDAEADALRAAGASVVGPAVPPGVELLDAVTVMDRLRSPGGCPWDAEQTHESLRKYLVEETYELLDAIEHADREVLREELGDVLLQVLFHARVATEDGTDPFDIDDVAAGLVSKLVSRHPNVFAEDSSVLDAESQHARWEELKQQEKQRESIVDGVATGQPAVALAAKLVQRADRHGVPHDLLPDGDSTGDRLFALAAQASRAGEDPEGELRATAVRLIERIRTAERRAKRDGHDPTRMTPEQWRCAWAEAESGEDAAADVAEGH